MDSLLSTSPRSSIMCHAMLENDSDKETTTITLEEFVEELPNFIGQCKEQINPSGIQQGNSGNNLADPIRNLLMRVRLDKSEWERFAFVDPHKSYTRNLVATDHQTFTLLLLCWTPGCSSPIHDHPCDGCWMRVLQGSVRECRYVKQGDELICTQDVVYDDGVVFIEDSQGYHKVGNPSKTETAITLHLYSPPFERCRIWLDEKRDHPCQSCICHYSEYGRKT